MGLLNERNQKLIENAIWDALISNASHLAYKSMQETDGEEYAENNAHREGYSDAVLWVPELKAYILEQIKDAIIVITSELEFCVNFESLPEDQRILLDRAIARTIPGR